MQAQQTHSEPESLTHATVNALADAILTVDDQGTIELVNPAAGRLFGYPASELIGKNVSLLLPPPYHDVFETHPRNHRNGASETLVGIGQDVVGRRKDGTTFPMDLAISEVQFGNRRLFTGIARSIAERKKADEQLESFADELRKRNAELLRSNQELDDFAYIASHDLKEPLRGIHNYVGFLMEDYGDKFDAEGVAQLNALRQLARRMDALIESLLETSRVGRLELAIRETNLNDLVSEIVDSLRTNLDERGVEVRIPRPLPTLRCDRVRAGEVFRNLITNAMKYNDQPEKWIEVGTCHVASEREQGASQSTHSCEAFAFYVRDNGIGIHPKHFDSIFRIFKRLHGRTEFGGGTGVGLTIVKKIVERHGGRIWVQSTPGEGTTFLFTLSQSG